ncbi:MAG TPA: glycerol kinase GlpK [Gemmatimonadaceae bacterium]|nr:glycerol kinase GlpK [Gemmatimonadaceae bacterium]
MSHVLAIDAGTTGVTCLMVRDDGAITSRAYREVRQFFPQPGWVEHDADQIFEAVVSAAREAIGKAGESPVSLGITNQRETAVAWDRATGKPLQHAIVWQDRRTTARCAELAPVHGARITQLTGLVVDAYFSATKFEWLLRKHAGAKNGMLLGTIDTWLIWRLTGGKVFATDPSNASRTMLYDINALRWSADLCSLFGVPVSALPEVRESSGDFGVALREHLGVEVPIRGVAGDQQSALFGQGCWQRGMAKNTYGTGAFLLLYAGGERPVAERGLLATVGCDERGRPAYALEAAIFIAGAAIQWLRDSLGIIKSADETQALAEAVDGNHGVYFVPALTGLGAPHWEADARGTIVGLTRGSTRAHLTRAALEAMAYGTADVLAAMAHASGAHFPRLRVDGGATSNDWLMQFQADVLGVPVERPDCIETTALGAAGLAGIASGVWATADEFISQRTFHAFEPQMSREDAAALMHGWHRAVGAATHWARTRE